MEEEAKHLVQIAYSLPPLPLLIFLTATVAMDYFFFSLSLSIRGMWGVVSLYRSLTLPASKRPWV